MSQLWNDAGRNLVPGDSGIIYVNGVLNRAVKRCYEISQSEALLGYTTSAEDYTAMREELREALTFIFDENLKTDRTAKAKAA